jgi:hypothetical protein
MVCLMVCMGHEMTMDEVCVWALLWSNSFFLLNFGLFFSSMNDVKAAMMSTRHNSDSLNPFLGDGVHADIILIFSIHNNVASPMSIPR